MEGYTNLRRKSEVSRMDIIKETRSRGRFTPREIGIFSAGVFVLLLIFLGISGTVEDYEATWDSPNEDT
jgi:hypothetical protein